MAIRVVVADDQELVRAGFAMILEAQPDIEVVAEAPDGAEAVARADPRGRGGNAAAAWGPLPGTGPARSAASATPAQHESWGGRGTWESSTDGSP